MRFFTRQGYDLRTFSGRIDATRSTYADHSNVIELYPRLHGIVGTSQFLWCKAEPQTREFDYLLKSPAFDHELIVAEEAILGTVIGWRWQLLIHPTSSHYVPSDVYQRWQAEDPFDRHIQRGRDWVCDWLQQNGIDKAWNGIFSPFEASSLGPNDDILVRWPLERKEILDVREVRPPARP